MDFRSLIPVRRGGGVSRVAAEDPFTSLRREMDRMFDDFLREWPTPATGASAFLSPRVNVAETETGLEIEAELPGVPQDAIDLDLSDGVLTLRAEHKDEREEKDDKKQYHMVERSYGTFLRRLALPFQPDEDNIQATFDKGVLKVAIPRAAPLEAGAKKIPISAA